MGTRMAPAMARSANENVRFTMNETSRTVNETAVAAAPETYDARSSDRHGRDADHDHDEPVRLVDSDEPLVVETGECFLRSSRRTLIASMHGAMLSVMRRDGEFCHANPTNTP